METTEVFKSEVAYTDESKFQKYCKFVLAKNSDWINEKISKLTKKMFEQGYNESDIKIEINYTFHPTNDLYHNLTVFAKNQHLTLFETKRMSNVQPSEIYTKEENEIIYQLLKDIKETEERRKTEIYNWIKIKYISKIQEWLDGKNSENIYISELSQTFYNPYDFPRLAIQAECDENFIKQINDKIKSDENKREEAKKLAEKKKEEGLENMKKWALQFGSDRVKLAIQLNQFWTKLAEAEYVESVLSELKGYEKLDDLNYDEEKDRTFPTLAELKELERIKNLNRDDLSDFDLSYFVVENKLDDEGYEVPEEKFPAVVATITTPNQKTFRIYRRF